jgi:hypothetical protein
VAIFWNTAAGRPAVEHHYAVSQDAARAPGIDLVAVQVLSADALDAAFQEAKKVRSGAIVTIQSALFQALNGRLAELALTYRLPVLSSETGFAEAERVAGGIRTRRRPLMQTPTTPDGEPSGAVRMPRQRALPGLRQGRAAGAADGVTAHNTEGSDEDSEAPGGTGDDASGTGETGQGRAVAYLHARIGRAQVSQYPTRQKLARALGVPVTELLE